MAQNYANAPLDPAANITSVSNPGVQDLGKNFVTPSVEPVSVQEVDNIPFSINTEPALPQVNYAPGMLAKQLQDANRLALTPQSDEAIAAMQNQAAMSDGSLAGSGITPQPGNLAPAPVETASDFTNAPRAVQAPVTETPTADARLTQFDAAAKSEAAIARAAEQAQKQREDQLDVQKALAARRIKQIEDFKTNTQTAYGLQEDALRDLTTKYKEQYAKELDPNRANIFVNGTTGQKIGGAIALILGGLGGTNGSNVALDIFNKAIEKDIAAQKYNLDRGAEGLDKQAATQKSLYQTMLQKFNNSDQADAATRMVMLDNVEAQLKNISGQYDSKVVKAKSQAAIGALAAQKETAKRQFQFAAQQQAVMQALTGQAGGQAAQTGVKDPAVFSRLNATLPPEVQKENRERYVPGYGLAASKDLAQDFSKFRSETEPSIDLAKTLSNKYKNFNRLDLKEQRELKTMQTNLIGNLRLAFTGPGAMTESEYQRILDAIGNLSSPFSIPSLNQASIDTVIKGLQKNLNERAKVAGLESAVPMKVNFTPSK